MSVHNKMRLIPQSTRFKITNWLLDDNTNRNRKNGTLLPNNIRCLICGPSNCGKTNVLLSLLLDSNGVSFCNVYLYSKSTQQPKYLFLNEVLDKVEEISYYTYSDKNDVIPPDEAKENSVVIFDDVSLENQDTIRQYFAMGRHRGLDCFYLCQTYSKIPKQLVRDNANLIVIFKQDELNLRHVYDDHVNTDMLWEKFKEICATCWEQKWSFLVIDKDRNMEKGRYRKGFDNFIMI